MSFVIFMLTLLFLLSLYFPTFLTMSLIPSSTPVLDMLTTLRAEREIAKTAFRAAVAEASIRWEAELLLLLEEYRDAGGFVSIQDQCRREVTQDRNVRKQSRHASVSAQHTMGSQHLQPFAGHDEQIHNIFIPDIMDLNKAFVFAGANIKCVGDPTMATERASLRSRMLGAVKQEFRDAINAELEEQDARDKALLEERARGQKEEQEARRRLLGRF